MSRKEKGLMDMDNKVVDCRAGGRYKGNKNGNGKNKIKINFFKLSCHHLFWHMAFLFYFLKDIIYLFLERGEGREKE